MLKYLCFFGVCFIMGHLFMHSIFSLVNPHKRQCVEHRQVEEVISYGTRGEFNGISVTFYSSEGEVHRQDGLLQEGDKVCKRWERI